jgi:hypothetical protein
MALFDFLLTKKGFDDVDIKPFKDDSVNRIYNRLFCDDLLLYKMKARKPYSYPNDILFSRSSSISDLQRIIEDGSSCTRLKILAYNELRSKGFYPLINEVHAIIIELAQENGLNLFAMFSDGTVRSVNKLGRFMVWEVSDQKALKLKQELFLNGELILKQFSVLDKPRKLAPVNGNVRITVLDSYGLHFGEERFDMISKDQISWQILDSAAQLRNYLKEKSLGVTS